MNSREILILKEKAYHCLAQKQLKDACAVIAKLVVNAQDWTASEKLNELESNYKYMLHYMFEGIKDPKNDDIHNKLIRSAYELLDDVVDELLLLESSDYFYERSRLDALKSEKAKDHYLQIKDLIASSALYDLLEDGEEKKRKIKEAAIQRERAGVLLFNSIFIAPRAKKDDLDSYLEFVNGYEISTREKCLIISALTLNILHKFDALKMQALLECTQSDVMYVRTRAIVGLVVILQLYDDRWALYPELSAKLEAFSENIDFRKSILRVIIQLIRARDTERISKKVTEEIIPQMMKFSNIAGKKISMEDLMGETDFMDKNPDWQKELEDSGLSKKLQEYSELQLEGADVFHSTFSGLKSFPFFSEMSNWFMPFDKSYSEISELFPHENKDSLLNIAIADSGHMCNSDKYSFSLSLLQVPTSQREMMMNRMGAESEEVKRMQKEAQAMNPQMEEEVNSNQYIQDLYRFYKLNPRRSGFQDIFKFDLNFYENKAIAPIISDLDSMSKIANYCFDKNFLPIALSIYNLIAVKYEATATTWQKIGYCYQMDNNKDEALKAYLHSDLLAPDKTWTLRKIAQLYRSMGSPQKALEYYEKVAHLTPNNISVELNIGHCYLEIKEYDKALNNFFKVEILDNTGTKAYRPIAWTAFLLKKYDVAEKYYIKVKQDNPTIHDYLNMGHLQLAQDKMKSALEYYNHAAMIAPDMEQFQALFLADKGSLITNGVDEKIFPYLFDQVKYMLD